MRFSEIRKELDQINSADVTEDAAQRIMQIEESFSYYNGTNLGEARALIENRLHLAHSRRVRAGH